MNPSPNRPAAVAVRGQTGDDDRRAFVRERGHLRVLDGVVLAVMADHLPGPEVSDYFDGLLEHL